MSFSSDTKSELCRTEPDSRQNAIMECYGVLLFCNTFTGREIRISTRSGAFAERLPRLFRRAFGAEFTEMAAGDNGRTTFILRGGEALGRILEAFGCDRRGVVAHHINLGLLEDEGARTSFLRGAFLAGGSVTDPAKRYHLELCTGHYSVSRETEALLIDMGFEPRTAVRDGNYVMYFKQSGVIEDLLTTLGAPVAAMGVMAAKIEKDMTNTVNRKVNCDTANVSKIVEASAAQLAAIRALRERGELATLPFKLRETAELRERYPEAALSELAEMFEPPVTKSCLNHRLRKLVELGKE